MLTSILEEGAQFSSLAETALADRLNHMLELVTAETPDGDLPLVMALIDSVAPEHIVSGLFVSLCVLLIQGRCSGCVVLGFFAVSRSLVVQLSVVEGCNTSGQSLLQLENSMHIFL